MQFYEYSRDNHRYPECWESDNPNCYPHVHKSAEAIYIIEGKIRALLNGKEYTASAGQLLIVPGYIIHSFQMTDQTKAWVCTIPVHVIAAYKQILSKQTFSKLLLDIPQYDSQNRENRLITYFKKVRDLSGCLQEKESLAQSAEMTGYAYLILAYLMEHAGMEPVSSVKMATFTQDVLNYLDGIYLDSCDLEGIARHFGYSKSRFSHLFNETFGCRLIEYINGLRCAHALTLIEDGKKTITDIALESGFETTRTFYRAFRKYYGASPSDFMMGNAS